MMTGVSLPVMPAPAQPVAAPRRGDDDLYRCAAKGHQPGTLLPLVGAMMTCPELVKRRVQIVVLLPLVGGMMTVPYPDRSRALPGLLLPLVGAMMTEALSRPRTRRRGVAAPRRGDDDCAAPRRTPSWHSCCCPS